VLLALLTMKLGEPPGRKTVLYPPRFETARMGLSIVSCALSALSAAEIAGFSAKCGLWIFKKWSVDVRVSRDEAEFMRKGS
jgi:hypothetical protein